MSARKIPVFMYGASINLKVQELAGLKKRAFAPASILGFTLTIQPIANLHEDGDGIVYGTLANFTEAEREKLQSGYVKKITEATYEVEPVLVHTRGGKLVPAITLISTNLEPAPANDAYIDRIMKAADTYGYPQWYKDRINQYRPE